MSLEASDCGRPTAWLRISCPEPDPVGARARDLTVVGSRALQRPLALTIVTGVLVQGVAAGLQQGLGSIAPALRERVDATPAELSVLIGAMGIGVTCAVLVGGTLADRVGERAVVVGGLLVCTVALVFASRQKVFAGLLVCLLFVGFGLGGPNGATGKALAQRAGPHRLGLALGLRQMAVPLGTAGASYMLPRIAAHHGVERSMLVVSGIYLIAVALTVVGFGGREPAQPKSSPALRDTLADRRLLLVMIGSGMFTFPQWAYLGYLVLYLHDARGWDGVNAATLLASVLLFGGLVRAAVGWVSDRIPHRRAALLGGCGALPGVLSLAAGLAAGAGSAWVVPLLVAAGIASMSWNGMPFIVVAATCPPERLGSVHGLLSTILYGLGAVAALVIGMIRAASTWPVTWMSLALFALAGLFLVWRGTQGGLNVDPNPHALTGCERS